MSQGGHGIFICYRREDSADVAARIYDALVNRFGRQMIFKDVDDIPLGFDFREVIDRKLDESLAVLVIIGNQWLTVTNKKGARRLDDTNDHVRYEIQAALEKKVPVIPVLVHEADHPAEEDLPECIRTLHFRQSAAVRRDPHFSRDASALCEELERTLAVVRPRVPVPVQEMPAQPAVPLSVVASPHPAPAAKTVPPKVPEAAESAESAEPAAMPGGAYTTWGFFWRWTLSCLLAACPPLSAYVQHRLLRSHVKGSLRWFWFIGFTDAAALIAMIIASMANIRYNRNSSGSYYPGQYTFDVGYIWSVAAAALVVAGFVQCFWVCGRWSKRWWLWLIRLAAVLQLPLPAFSGTGYYDSSGKVFATWLIGYPLASLAFTPWCVFFMLRKMRTTAVP